jgi:fumarylacetoacetate (FAA) hydrolase family protein
VRDTLPDDLERAVLIGRAWNPAAGGPSVVTVRDGAVVDITTRAAPTCRDVLERADAAAHVRAADGPALGPVEAVLDNSFEDRRDPGRPYLLAPCDLQAVKASGVTFVVSLLERVIEERAGGDPGKAADVRARVMDVIGGDLAGLKPGSPEAMELKAHLIEEGIWSQYLEVGIGPDPEVFTKAQPMSAVGFGADVGILPISKWNNPEPEVVLAVSSDGAIKGATLGNDVNLRDIEGRSALLLGKCKDNNASAAIGPFIRLFDDAFTLEDAGRLVVELVVEGEDGYRVEGRSEMAQISRAPADLVAATVGPHHQYPDGLLLYLGTMFAPTDDREGPGLGFTHKTGDRVTVRSDRLGALVNRVRMTDQCAPRTYGTAALMRNLAGRGLL